ncbi:hypothetical protein KOXY103107_17415 [Komagataeibacter xylinus]
MGQEPGASHAPWDRARWRFRLHHCFAMTAGFLQPCRFDDFQFCCDEFKDFGDIFANEAQGAATGGTGFTRVEHNALPWSGVRDPGSAAPSLGRDHGIAVIAPLTFGRRIGCRDGDFHIFEEQFELFSLTLDLF